MLSLMLSSTFTGLRLYPVFLSPSNIVLLPSRCTWTDQRRPVYRTVTDKVLIYPFLPLLARWGPCIENSNSSGKLKPQCSFYQKLPWAFHIFLTVLGCFFSILYPYWNSLDLQPNSLFPFDSIFNTLIFRKD